MRFWSPAWFAVENEPGPPPQGSPSGGLRLAWLILALAVSATLLGWYNTRQDVRAARQQRFHDCISELAEVLGQAVTTRESLVRGSAALFMSSDHVTAREWNNYVNRLELPRDFPDVMTLGHAPLVQRSELPALSARTAQEGLGVLRVHPESTREIVAPIMYLESLDNKPVPQRGFDLTSVPEVRAMIERSGATGDIAILNRRSVTPRGEEHATELLLLKPIVTTNSRAEHPTITGLVFGRLHLARMVEETLGNRLQEFQVQIYEGATANGEPLYDNAPGNPGELSTQVTVNAAGDTWTIRFSTLPAFARQSPLNTERVILIAGTAISLLLFAISWSLATTRERALRIAESMTGELHEERARLSEIAATIGEGIFVQDAEGTITYTNPAAADLLGWKASELTGKPSAEIFSGEATAAGIGTHRHIVERLGSTRGPYVPEETELLRRDGTRLPVSLVSTPILREGQAVGAVLVFQDISQRRHAEAALRETRQFELLFQFSADALFIMDLDGRVLDLNRVALESLGYTREELIGASSDKYVRWATLPRLGETVEDFFAELQGKNQQVRGEAEHVRKDGSSFLVEVVFSPIVHDDRRTILVAARDITDRKEAELRIQRALDDLERSRREVEEANRRLAEYNYELQNLSRRDSLTAIANRRSFDEYLQLEWSRAARDQRPLSLLIADVDHFKAYNDTYGHPAGDDCLRRIAAVLDRELSRSIDMVARYGGEEFVVVLPETPATGAFNIAERLRRAVAELNIPHARSNAAECVTISVGAATIVPSAGGSRQALVEAADTALYRAKQKGRNRVVSALEPGA